MSSIPSPGRVTWRTLIRWALPKRGIREHLTNLNCLQHSQESFTYAEAQLRIDDVNQQDEISKSLRQLNKLAQILKKGRIDKGLVADTVRLDLSQSVSVFVRWTVTDCVDWTWLLSTVHFETKQNLLYLGTWVLTFLWGILNWALSYWNYYRWLDRSLFTSQSPWGTVLIQRLPSWTRSQELQQTSSSTFPKQLNISAFCGRAVVYK